jgi:glutaredoxin
MKTSLFIKPPCPWCHKAMRWLDEHGIEYKTLDVIANKAAFDEWCVCLDRNWRRLLTWMARR